VDYRRQAQIKKINANISVYRSQFLGSQQIRISQSEITAGDIEDEKLRS